MMKRRLAATLIASCFGVGALVSPADAVQGKVAERSDGHFALVSFKAPAQQTLRIPRNGACVIPQFGWKIVTNYANVQFGGNVTVTSKRTTYGSAGAPNFSVNRDQSVTLTKPICKPGTFKVTVRGSVTSQIPYDGMNFETYETVSDSRTYQVTAIRRK